MSNEDAVIFLVFDGERSNPCEKNLPICNNVVMPPKVGGRVIKVVAMLMIDCLTETDDVLSGLDQGEALLLSSGGVAELNFLSGNDKPS